MNRILIALLIAGWLPVAPLAAAPIPSRSEMIGNLVSAAERNWKKLAVDPVPDNTSSRDLFSYALALCESGQQLDRLERLFTIAAQMQDRDPASRSYGNFRWNWGQPKVMDYNAVDFCMQGAALIWLKHRAILPPAAREKLREILQHAVPGSLKHRVTDSYTNIALMNAANLILLGEALGQPEVAAEGQKRLNAAILYTWKNGTHEYGSPTYYGVDLEVLGELEAHTQNPRVRQQARAMLELFWTDIAANWVPWAQKLGGAHSRDYDYLRGLGILDQHLLIAGWIEGEPPKSVGSVHGLLGNYHPTPAIVALSRSAQPRLVSSSWGTKDCEFRAHYVLPDVSLSTAGANYGAMDLPFTFDLPGPRTGTRGYFIPDGRHDPYGKLKIPDRSGHTKTLHLMPFFAAAQNRGDALGLVVYRDKDIPTNSTTLESHFVLPKAVDSVWINDREVKPGKTALAIPVKASEVVVLRKGTAAVALQVPWSRDVTGAPAAVALVWDANDYESIRLTADHRLPGLERPKNHFASAVFRVRIGSGLKTEAQFAEWKKALLATETKVQASAGSVSVEIPNGGLSIKANAPFTACPTITPAGGKDVLKINGEDIGRKLLERLDLEAQ